MENPQKKWMMMDDDGWWLVDLVLPF
jgi:hypothetical protein